MRPAVLALPLALALAAGAAGAGEDGFVSVSYLYRLSDFAGTLPYSDARLFADRARNEIYVMTGNSVRVFNAAGMEVHQFAIAPSYGSIIDLAVDDAGDPLLLVYTPAWVDKDAGWSLLRCDYRGVPLEKYPITGLPPGPAAGRPDIMAYRDGRIVLIQPLGLLAIEIDRQGAFLKVHDLARRIGLDEEERGKNDIASAFLDAGGRLVFTIPTLFEVFAVSLDSDAPAERFGKGGSAPGSFSVLGGVVVDDHGHFVVADKGRSTVLIFDAGHGFITEFGPGPDKPSTLIRPSDLVIGNDDKLYVTQARDRGIAVFRLWRPAPPQAPEPPPEAGPEPGRP